MVPCSFDTVEDYSSMKQCVAQWKEIEGPIHLYTDGNKLLCKGNLPRIL